MTLDDIKAYLREDSEDEDTLRTITGFMAAASKEIQRRTGKTKVLVIEEDGTTTTDDIVNDELWQLAVKIAVADMYENRGSESPGAVNKFGRTFDSMVQFIALCGDYT